MWAAAILVVSIVEEKEFAVLMLVILATTSLINLKKGMNKKEIAFYLKFHQGFRKNYNLNSALKMN